MRFTFPSLTTLACLHSLPAVAFAQVITPAAQADAFYHWYLDQSGRAQPALMESKITDYATPNLVKRLRSTYRANGFAEGADYFLKVQDYDETD
ncbi:hypothetical protein [Acetobacter nitrogenifigens]|uniref:hypothetical protein n=1 Tax=Acetobacter nitrogenifigens TaxID=285268 RepID=UPI0012B62442|nr:hypothetical protein [Acetobacter nitrogenifigens]